MAYAAPSVRLRLTSYIVIPARLASTRLPRKLLLRETGKSLLQHTYESAQRAMLPAGLCVAADHEAENMAIYRDKLGMKELFRGGPIDGNLQWNSDIGWRRDRAAATRSRCRCLRVSGRRDEGDGKRAAGGCSAELSSHRSLQ